MSVFGSLVVSAAHGPEIHWLSCLACEHPINVWVRKGGEPIGLIDSVIHESCPGGLADGTDPIGVHALEIVILIKHVMLLFNVDLVGVEINVTPTQANEFSPPHAGVECQDDEGVPMVILGGIKDPDDFLIR